MARLFCLVALAVMLGGCACGAGGQRCVTSYTYTQPQPGTWVVTVGYGN